jgi:hypothetical protein
MKISVKIHCIEVIFNNMSFKSLSAIGLSVICLAFLLVFHCGKDNPASVARTPSELDKEITGVWRYALRYNPDTTIHIVMTYDSGYAYKISVDINNIDTMEKENGYWFIVSDTIAKADTVWMERHNCHQINLTTHTLDPIDCGVDTAGIKLNITQSSPKPVWIIPLNDFVNYLPAGIVDTGTTLPIVQFFKD